MPTIVRPAGRSPSSPGDLWGAGHRPQVGPLDVGTDFSLRDHEQTPNTESSRSNRSPRRGFYRVISVVFTPFAYGASCLMLNALREGGERSTRVELSPDVPG